MTLKWLMVCPTIDCTPYAMELRSILRLEGVTGNGKGPLNEIKLPERGHIETLLRDGRRLASLVTREEGHTTPHPLCAPKGDPPARNFSQISGASFLLSCLYDLIKYVASDIRC